MEKFLDRYAWQARRFPVFIVSLPLYLWFLAWVPKAEDALKPLGGLLASTGVLLLLAQVTRDVGKKAEAKLVQSWTAMPSVLMLRHGDPTIDSITKQRYHTALQNLVPGIQMPTPKAEAADPVSADAVYKSCNAYLLSKTRDEKKFPLILAENINYGFRRNLFGLKTWGVIVSGLGTGGCLTKLASDYQQQDAISVLPAVSLAGCLLLLLIWSLQINEQWVRSAADAYARRLLEATELLSADRTT